MTIMKIMTLKTNLTNRFVRAFRDRVSPEQRPIVVHCRWDE